MACNVVILSHCDGVRSTRLPASASIVSTRTQHDYLTPGQRVNIAFIAPTSYSIISRRATVLLVLLYVSELHAPAVLLQCTRHYEGPRGGQREAGKT